MVRPRHVSNVCKPRSPGATGSRRRRRKEIPANTDQSLFSSGIRLRGRSERFPSLYRKNRCASLPYRGTVKQGGARRSDPETTSPGANALCDRYWMCFSVSQAMVSKRVMSDTWSKLSLFCDSVVGYGARMTTSSRVWPPSS